MALPQTTTLKLRRVRFKDGRTIEVLRPKKDKTISNALVATCKRVKEFDAENEAVGFAVVGWAKNGNVYVNFQNGDASPLVGAQVPQYVKDVLLAETAVRWARDG